MSSSKYRIFNSCVILVLLDLAVWIEACHTFNNTQIIANQKNGPQFRKIVTGCLERKSFDGETVTELFIRYQDIPTFDIDAIRHLVQLNKLSIWKCGMNEIRPRSFRNVPRLKQVNINYCNLRRIPKNVFNLAPSLEQIRLHNNFIRTIDEEAFKNLTHLKRFNVSHNELTTYNPKWFKDSEHMERLDFSYNSIEFIPDDAFKNQRGLRYVYFENNEIIHIGRNSFSGIFFISNLKLGHNRIVTIDSEAFPNDIRINWLHIEANYLSNIPDEVLSGVKPRRVAMYGNPIICKCLEKLRMWLNVNNSRLYVREVCDKSSVPICVVPTVSKNDSCGQTLHTIDRERFLNEYRLYRPVLDRSCARLDSISTLLQ